MEKRKSQAALAQKRTNKQIQKDVAKRAAKTTKKSKSKLTTEFPKIATDAKIQGAGYDSSTGSFVKLKDLSFSSGQLERLIAIAQDGKARVRITIEEINPRFDSEPKEKTPTDDEPTFEEVNKGVSEAVEKETSKKSKKEAADGGSKLPI